MPNSERLSAEAHAGLLYPILHVARTVELYRLTQPPRNLQPRYNIAPTTIIDAVT